MWLFLCRRPRNFVMDRPGQMRIQKMGVPWMADLKKCTSFGVRVKIALIERNMSNKELAKKLGYSNSTINDVIFGRNCSSRTMELIAKELGIEVEELV